MSSKAERKRRKRTVIVAKGGRPRKDGPREPSGKLDRKWAADESARSATQTARDARQRLFGLSESVCAQPEAMTVLGRLKLIGTISPEQYDAARTYQELRVRHQRAIAAPLDYREPPPEENSTGVDFEDWVRQTRDQYAEMMQVLADLCQSLRDPAPKAALEVIVNRDIDLPELHGALRLALNALNRHFAGTRVREPEMAA